MAPNFRFSHELTRPESLTLRYNYGKKSWL
jgi:hypothetical protein